MYSNILDNFPWDNIRPSQKWVLEQIREVFNTTDKKFILIEAPTGCGKSLISVTAALTAHRSYISTANKSLQDQYIRDFNEYLVELKGKANYECYEHAGHNCANSPCKNAKRKKVEIIEKVEKPKEEKPAADKIRKLLNKKIENGCTEAETNTASSIANKMAIKHDINIADLGKKPKTVTTIKKTEKTVIIPPSECPGECEYHFQKAKASTAKITLMNTAALLTYLAHDKKNFNKRNLMVLDEVHLLPDQLTNQIEISISKKTLEKYGIKVDIPDFQDTDHYSGFVRQISALLESKTTIPEDITDDEHKAYKEKLKNFNKLDFSNFAVLKEWEFGTVINKVSFKPIVLGKYAEDYLWQHGDRFILMSATILDFKTFCHVLSIPQDKTHIIKLVSEFPKENRPIFTNTVIAPLSQKNLDVCLPDIVRTCKSILDHYKEHKGIIHGTSYKICQYIADNIKDSRILFPKSAFEQKEILEKHRNTKEPTVLLSPSMTVGIDLKDAESRFQILVKMPFPYLGDPVIKKRMEIYPGYYDMCTALTLVQAYGRSIRSVDDWAHTFILDGQFFRLVRNRELFPSWFLEAIQ